METNFIKLFRLAQLTIEYLLVCHVKNLESCTCMCIIIQFQHSQQYLSDHCTQLEQELDAAQQVVGILICNIIINCVC